MCCWPPRCRCCALAGSPLAGGLRRQGRDVRADVGLPADPAGAVGRAVESCRIGLRLGVFDLGSVYVPVVVRGVRLQVVLVLRRMPPVKALVDNARRRWLTKHSAATTPIRGSAHTRPGGCNAPGAVAAARPALRASGPRLRGRGREAGTHRRATNRSSPRPRLVLAGAGRVAGGGGVRRGRRPGSAGRPGSQRGSAGVGYQCAVGGSHHGPAHHRSQYACGPTR